MEFEEIRILIFNIMGVNLGMDMEQISEMHKPDQIREHIKEQNIKIPWFHEKVLFRKQPVIYKSPVILFIKKNDKTFGIIIDQPDDINVSVSVNSICPLPPLIEAVSRSGPIWGVTVKQGKIILLVDSYKLFLISHYRHSGI